MSLFSIERLQVSIYGQPILKGVSLSVGEGEILGLVGESGSGKSMTALAAMRLLPRGARTQGRILLAGDRLGHFRHDSTRPWDRHAIQG